jgi:serine/threonine protein kinase
MGIPFGRYELLKRIAAGGMGEVFLARQAGMQGFEKLLVVKVLLPHLLEDEEFVAMFLDEARIAAHLNHPNIAQIFDLGEVEGAFFIAMEYVHGEDVVRLWKASRAARKPVPLALAVRIAADASAGLDYAHKAVDGSQRPLLIVHRDVSPQNVLVTFEGGVKVIDFGVAKAADRSSHTATGTLKGKYSYMSPEQCTNAPLDRRSDVFALGILLYELSTLRYAFRDSSDQATMQRIKLGKVVRPSQVAGDYPPELEAIVMKALQVDPRDRFADADAMRRAIEALGHRRHFVLGDAAVIEVMAQLYAAQAPGASQHSPSQVSEPELEWAESDRDLTVRRDPAELLAVMRAEIANVELPPPTPPPVPVRPPRAGAPVVAKPVPKLPVTARPVAEPLVVAKPAVAQPRPPAASLMTPKIGANLVRVRTQRRSRLRWMAAIAVLGVLGGLGYVVMQESSSAVAGSASPPVSLPIAARTPTVSPSPPEPAPVPAPSLAPPPVPARVRMRIVTHPEGVTVLLDGKRLGRTPLDETIAADPGTHVIKLRRRGYVTQLLEVELDADVTQDLTLVPQK